jgi:hypothetical protein
MSRSAILSQKATRGALTDNDAGSPLAFCGVQERADQQAMEYRLANLGLRRLM